MPNRLLESKFSRIPGAYAIGDALNMRHPLTGALIEEMHIHFNFKINS